MRLLLDEHYDNEIAKQLRRRRHDVVAITERRGLAQLRDEDLFRLMPAERRAIVTENVVHFMPLVQQAARAGTGHYGLVFTSPQRLPRSKKTSGLYVRALAVLLRERPEDDALLNQVHWLS